MKIRIAAAFCCALLLGACTSKPIYSVQDQSVATKVANASQQDVRRAIGRAAAHLGWTVADEGPNKVIATLNLRTHVAVVEIPYSASRYSIAYKDSTNLQYDGQSIHRNYNGWVQNLQKAIDVELQNL